MKIVATVLCLVVAVLTVKPGESNQKSPAKRNLRVHHGDTDTQNEFPYVVALCFDPPKLGKEVIGYRACTGSLIADSWVITAAHCLQPGVAKIQYGEMTLPDTTATYSNIVKKVPHPNYNFIILSGHFMSKVMEAPQFIKSRNDIALLLVERVPLETYGTLSAVDYTAMWGHPVRYAGFGATYGDESIARDLFIKIINEDQRRPLQVGDGMASKCEKHNEGLVGPHICVVSKCSRRTQHIVAGDSGGPVIYFGKISGVLMGRSSKTQYRYTPVSLYLEWISAVMAQEQ